MEIYWVIGLVFLIGVVLGVKFLCQNLISRALLLFSRRFGLSPQVSETEMAAIQSGKTGIEKLFFSPQLDIEKLQKYIEPELSDEEKEFLNGPVEELCKMVNDLSVWKYRLDKFRLVHKIDSLIP